MLRMGMLYIPFLDGRIGYDCMTCGSKCCRNGSMVLSSEERLVVLQRHPTLALTAGDRYEDDSRVYYKLEPRCFFLAPSGLCDIEETLGRSAKPRICRTHPVYFSRFGDVSVATLAPGCYWVRDEAPVTGALIRWPDVEAAHVDLQSMTGHGALPAAFHDQDLAGVFEIEAMIRDAAPRLGDAREHFAWQLGLGREAKEPAEAAIAKARDRLSAIEQAMGALLRVDPASYPASAALERVFLDFGPILRLALFGMTQQFGQLGLPLPSFERLHAIVPQLLFALYVYARILDRLGLHGTMGSFNGVHQLLLRTRDRLFACTQLVDELSPNVAQRLDRSIQVQPSMCQLVAQAPRKILVEHLLPMAEGASLEQIVTFLDEVGRAAGTNPWRERKTA